MNNAQLINQDSGDYEYYTPPEIIEAAREVMGCIDLDPASSVIANKQIKADRIISPVFEFKEVEYWGSPGVAKLTGGHDQEWKGNIWLNHPFARSEAPCKKDCAKKACKKRGYHTFIPLPGNKEWIGNLIRNYHNGNIYQSCNITYVNTSEVWFWPLLDYLQCFIKGRVNYYKPDGTIKKGATKGSVVTYLGPNKEKFKEVFSKFGRVK